MLFLPPEKGGEGHPHVLAEADARELPPLSHLIDVLLRDGQAGRNLRNGQEPIVRRDLELAVPAGRMAQSLRQERGLETDHPKQKIPRHLGR